MKVAVTGCAGYIGQRLLGLLEDDPEVESVLGIDIRSPGNQWSKLTLRTMDIRRPELGRVLANAEVDALVHLAFIVDPIHDELEMHDVNVRGTMNVCDAAATAKVQQLVIASSATAFGAFPDNPPRLKESDPTRPHPTFAYPAHKHALEVVGRAFAKRNPDVAVAFVRPCIVYGPHVDNYLSRFLLDLPIVIDVDGANAELQFVHEDDVARVFYQVLKSGESGNFHAVGQGVVSVSEVGELTGKPVVALPGWLVRPIIGLLWHLRAPLIEGPPGMLDFLRYPWLLDDRETRRKLGLSAPRTSRAVLKELIQVKG